MKDHEKRELVNALTEVAVKYATTQQLRERIARLVLPALSEPRCWESTTVCYTRFVTDERYQKFSPAVQKWYRPAWEKCATHNARVTGAEPKA